LKKYPYEFKIDDTLKIASIDGVEVSSTTGSTNNGDTSNGGTDSSGSTNNSGNSNFADSEEYKTMQATIAQLQEEVSSLKTSKTQIESTVTNLTDSLKNYATKEDISDSSVLSWTKLCTVTSTTAVLCNVKIDDYKYIGVATYNSSCSNSAFNPVMYSVTDFKKDFTSETNGLYSVWTNKRATIVYYNNGLYAKVENSGDTGIIYGIK
jgi:hypothetical protein